jgi:uncharacterized repeat protein (TIGR03803 family)
MDGNQPNPGLVQAANGDLYGTTTYGGANGTGTVFKITPSGALTVVYSFCSVISCADGQVPSQLTRASNGDFYGTTLFSGANFAGTVFKITPGGALTTLYSFCSLSGCEDGNGPDSGVIQGTDGNFYGGTVDGGITNADCPGGCGTLFKLTPSGTLTTLHSFDFTDGAAPNGLIQGSNGNFYGTMYGGGTNEQGTVFEISAEGRLTTLHNFHYPPDGAFPTGALVEASDGNFYGTTLGGGNISNGGTVFKITPTGTLTTLYDFCSQSKCTDGAWPEELVQDTNGEFYGATFKGGTHTACNSGEGCGTIFSLSVGLGPFVETRPPSGQAGWAVEILGSDLTGATSVTFEGIAASFTVVSRYLITATVPSGASTGPVEVVTPTRTLSSNVPFRVLP